MRYITILLMLISTISFSQGPMDVIEPDYIKTVILSPNSSNKYAPIIALGSSVTLSFDDLEADLKYYYYKIEHCNFDWLPSGLSDREYIKGYNSDRIRSEENSFNTLQFYTHYSITFPNRYTKILLSGNYIISVLDENKKTIFTRRLVIYESQVSIDMKVRRSRNISNLDTKQNVQFTIKHPNYRINNPKMELKTVLMQNNNWETAIKDLVPQYYRGYELIYKYLDETDFWGGYEFHYFDNKSVRAANAYIRRAEQGPDVYHTFLYTDFEHIDKPYTQNQDINGNFVIRNIEGRENYNRLDADYTWVFFSLSTSEDLTDKKLFVNGNFNNWKNNYNNEMRYNPRSGKYEAQILLKQGFYNYQYVTIDKDGQFSNHDIDGSYFQTENDYTLLVYYQPIGDRYLHVIGYQTAKSVDIEN